MVRVAGIEPAASCSQSRRASAALHAGIWWSQRGSNPQPSACKADALPFELWPRRRRWDSNPRRVAPRRFSRPMQSASLPRLLSKNVLRGPGLIPASRASTWPPAITRANGLNGLRRPALASPTSCPSTMPRKFVPATILVASTKWSAWPVSNRRPPPSKGGALPTALHAWKVLAPPTSRRGASELTGRGRRSAVRGRD